MQTPQLIAFDPNIMETDENKKDYKQEKFCSLSICTPVYLMRTKRGWNGEEKSRGGLLLPIHTSR
jgi:hypothetical protein